MWFAPGRSFRKDRTPRRAATSAGRSGAGGKRDKETRLLAERLAAGGDTPSGELQARVRDPVALSLNLASSLLGIAILVLMIWKPGAGG